MARQKLSKKQKLEKLRQLQERMVQSKKAVGSNGYWKPDPGRHVIRILPPVGDMEFFYQEVGKHYLPGNNSVYCPAFTTAQEFDCPICDLVYILYKGDTAAKALAKKLRVRKSFAMNIITRKDGDREGETYDGPFIFTPGITIFKSLESMVADPEIGDFTDEEDGIDIIIDRKGKTKNDTEYEVRARRINSPIISPDWTSFRTEEEAENAAWDAIDNLLGVYDTDTGKEISPPSVQDLMWVMLSDDPDKDEDLSDGKIVKLLPYERMIEQFGISPDTNASELSYEDEGSTSSDDKVGNNADSTVRSRISKRVSRRRGK